MGKLDKLLAKLENAKNTFAWSDLLTLLTQLGYEKKKWQAHWFGFSIIKLQHYYYINHTLRMNSKVEH